jgi:hypothetical protein
VDPNNAQLQSGLDEVMSEEARQGGGGMPGMPNMNNMFGPDMWTKIQMNPKLKGYLSDPTYVSVLHVFE